MCLTQCDHGWGDGATCTKFKQHLYKKKHDLQPHKVQIASRLTHKKHQHLKEYRFVSTKKQLTTQDVHELVHVKPTKCFISKAKQGNII